jgi:hypothetical protein
MNGNRKNLLFSIFNRNESDEEPIFPQTRNEDSSEKKQKELHLKFENMLSSRTVKKVKKGKSEEKDNLFNQMLNKLTNHEPKERPAFSNPISKSIF